jgi:hypothetical protein
MIRNNSLHWFLAAAIPLALPACETDLSAALDDVRATVPEVCKDYCEDLLTCEWNSTVDGLFEEAFSAAVRRCTIDCAFFVDEGAFVTEWLAFAGKTAYVSHVDGAAIEDALVCLFDLGAYACMEGESADTHGLSPVSETQCKAAATCLAGLDTDMSLTWHVGSDGGSCVHGGLQSLTVDYFE